MTVAEATPELDDVADRNDRAFLGHPKGLGYLAFVEGCERFSYYSMQTLLVLYMVNYLLPPSGSTRWSGLGWLQRLALRRARRPAARLGDLRRLHLAGLPDADPRRHHRRPLARPARGADRRRRW